VKNYTVRRYSSEDFEIWNAFVFSNFRKKSARSFSFLESMMMKEEDEN
jgi:hypothetical protein